MKLVLLPGMDGTGLLFEPLLKELDSEIGIKVIAYPTDTKLSYRQLTELVISELPLHEDYILLGESFSGAIAYEIAKNTPSHLKGILFLASFVSVPNRLLRFIGWVPLTPLLKIPLPQLFIKRFLLGGNIKIISLFRNVIKQVDSSVLSYRIQQMAQLQGVNGRIEIPACYIAAKQDKLVSPKHITEFQRFAPQSKVYTIDGPHFLAQSKPAECAEIIKKFIVGFT